jgi:L-ascorbate metabolism protein UlaG (beta-lactamase superfamily)
MDAGRATGGVTWLGHSTVVVDLDGARLVTDPLLRRRVMHLRRTPPLPVTPLANVTAILVSHVHFDHLDLPSLRRIAGSPALVVPRGTAELVRRGRLENVIEVDAGDEIDLGGLTVRATPAIHQARRGPFGPHSPSLGFAIAGSRTVYFAGDTDLFDAMREIGPVDLALLPVAGWGPTLPPGHLNPERAAAALALIRPEIAVPIHWGTLRTPFAPRPDDRAPRAFAAAAAELAPATEVRIVAVGGSSSFERSDARRSASSR